MQKRSTLLCLAFLLLANSAFSARFSKQEKALRFLENYATNSGNVPLVLGDQGFSVHVDFTNHASQASDSDDNTDDYGGMILALYTDQTFFGQSCPGFQDFCSKGDFAVICSKVLGEQVNATFPYFETLGVPIGPEIFLDYNHWSLKSPALLSNSCGHYEAGGYGLLGMGVSNYSWSNYLGKTPNFAIQVSKNLSNGTFAFNIDLNNAKSSEASAVLGADNLWHVSGVSSIVIKDDTISTDSSLIFDLGLDSIGFPQSLYDQVLTQIEKNAAVGGCQVGDDSRPICDFSGDIRNLPTITINLGSQQIEIPPEIYVVQTQDDNYFYYDPITLKLKILSSTGAKGTVSVTSAYENYIILGYPAMSYYYTVFEAGHPQGGSITLYASSEYSSASDMTWLFVVAGVVGLVMIGVIFYFYDKKYRKKIVVEDPLLGSHEAVKAKNVRRLH